MVGILSLWLPIVVAAVLVFVASSAIHMFLKYHNADYGAVPQEDAVMDALRPFGIAPGDYVLPNAGGDMELMRSEAFQEKVKKGPVAFITVLPQRDFMDMKPQLTQWFVYCLVVGVFAAYVAGRALGPGAEYLQVFRFSGVTAFVAYTVAGWQRSVWYAQPWGTTMRNTLDGLIYALLTAGAFGWLWPS